MSDDLDGEDDRKIPTGRGVNMRDWECRDCGTWWSADNDATSWDLPDFCPECGDHLGWVNVGDARRVP